MAEGFEIGSVFEFSGHVICCYVWYVFCKNPIMIRRYTRHYSEDNFISLFSLHTMKTFWGSHSTCADLPLNLLCFLAGLLFTIYLHLLWEGKLIHQKQVVISLGYFTSKYSYMSTPLVWGRKPITNHISPSSLYSATFSCKKLTIAFI